MTNKINDSAHQNRIDKFNEKIDRFSTHNKYEWLRKYADEAITWDSNCGYLQIKASDFIDRIIAMPLEYIRDWLDGKNKLEWNLLKS